MTGRQSSELPSCQPRCCAGSWEPDWRTGLYSFPSHPQRTEKRPLRKQCCRCSLTTGTLWQDVKIETGGGYLCGLNTLHKHYYNFQPQDGIINILPRASVWSFQNKIKSFALKCTWSVVSSVSFACVCDCVKVRERESYPLDWLHAHCGRSHIFPALRCCRPLWPQTPHWLLRWHTQRLPHGCLTHTQRQTQTHSYIVSLCNWKELFILNDKNSLYTDKDCIEVNANGQIWSDIKDIYQICKCLQVERLTDTVSISLSQILVSEHLLAVNWWQEWLRCILPWVTTLPNTGMVSRVEQFHRRLRNWNWHSSIASWAPRRTASITSTLRLQIWTWSRDTHELQQPHTASRYY